MYDREFVFVYAYYYEKDGVLRWDDRELENLFRPKSLCIYMYRTIF